jgi:DNA primase
MRRSRKVEALRHILGHEAFQKNDELIFFCKNRRGCDGKHHKPKLSVNVERDTFNCWVCGWSGLSLKAIFRADASLYQEYMASRSDGQVEADETVVYDTPILPEEFQSLSMRREADPYWRAATEYVLSRGLTELDIVRYKLGYCAAGEYKHRVIVPSFDRSGALNFFVGRKYYENVGENYKHGNFCKDIVFNDLMLDWSGPTILVEGPFDAMVAGANAIPLQGTILSEDSQLFARLVFARKPVFIALDSDAWKKQKRLVSLMYSYGIDVRSVDMRKSGVQDVAELGRPKFDELLRATTKLDNDLDLLKLRATA